MIAVGIDTHKESLAVCAVDELGRKLGELSVENGRRGFRRLERYLAGLPQPRRVGIEGSGGLGAPLAHLLARRPEQRWACENALGRLYLAVECVPCQGSWRVRASSRC